MFDTRARHEASVALARSVSADHQRTCAFVVFQMTEPCDCGGLEDASFRVQFSKRSRSFVVRIRQRDIFWQRYRELLDQGASVTKARLILRDVFAVQ